MNSSTSGEASANTPVRAVVGRVVVTARPLNGVVDVNPVGVNDVTNAMVSVSLIVPVLELGAMGRWIDRDGWMDGCVEADDTER